MVSATCLNFPAFKQSDNLYMHRCIQTGSTTTTHSSRFIRSLRSGNVCVDMHRCVQTGSTTTTQSPRFIHCAQETSVYLLQVMMCRISHSKLLITGERDSGSCKDQEPGTDGSAKQHVCIVIHVTLKLNVYMSHNIFTIVLSQLGIVNVPSASAFKTNDVCLSPPKTNDVRSWAINYTFCPETLVRSLA